jgi:hypothetical protein
VPAGAHVAIVRRIGYQARRAPVAVTAAEAGELSVVMQPATTQLSAQRIVSEARAARPGGTRRGRGAARDVRRRVPGRGRHRPPRRATPGERAAREVAREQERQRLAPSGAATQGLRAGSERGAAVDVAGCYRLTRETGDGAAAPGLPAFVVLDTAGTPVARRLQLRYPSPATGARPGGWRLGAGGPETAANAALAPVTVWWRDDRADWSMTLLRAGSVLSARRWGRPPPSAPRSRAGFACGSLPPRAGCCRPVRHPGPLGTSAGAVRPPDLTPSAPRSARGASMRSTISSLVVIVPRSRCRSVRRTWCSPAARRTPAACGR